MTEDLTKYLGKPRIVLTQPHLLEQFEREYVQTDPKVHQKTLRLTFNQSEKDELLKDLTEAYSELIHDFLDICDLHAVRQFKSFLKPKNMDAIHKAAAHVCALVLSGKIPIEKAVTVVLIANIFIEPDLPCLTFDFWIGNTEFDWNGAKMYFKSGPLVSLDQWLTMDNAEQTINTSLKAIIKDD